MEESTFQQHSTTASNAITALGQAAEASHKREQQLMQPQPDILCGGSVTLNGEDEDVDEDEDCNEADDNTTGIGLSKAEVIN